MCRIHTRFAALFGPRDGIEDVEGSSTAVQGTSRKLDEGLAQDVLLAPLEAGVIPLPHQISAVYESLLPRQPLRFLLADDPGAGKTIMAGLFIKELIARGDLQRCLIVCPGSLAEQWQDELYRRFQLPFEILTNDKLGAARTGNWFTETDISIADDDELLDRLAVSGCRQILVGLESPSSDELASIDPHDWKRRRGDRYPGWR